MITQSGGGVDMQGSFKSNWSNQLNKTIFLHPVFFAADLLELTESLREWVADFLISSAWVENGKQRQTLKFGNS